MRSIPRRLRKDEIEAGTKRAAIVRILRADEHWQRDRNNDVDQNSGRLHYVFDMHRREGGKETSKEREREEKQKITMYERKQVSRNYNVHFFHAVIFGCL